MYLCPTMVARQCGCDCLWFCVCTSGWVSCVLPWKLRPWTCVPTRGHRWVRVSVCAREGWGLRGDPRPSPAHTLQAPGGGSSGSDGCSKRPSSPPAPPPPPHPLPADRFADRPNRQKLRVRGPLGAFLLWCELPMAGAGAGEGNGAWPSQPGRRARSPGREAARLAGGHRGRPQPQPGHAPELRGQWPGRGRARAGAGPRASGRLRPSRDLGDLLSRPTQSTPGSPGRAGEAPALPP